MTITELEHRVTLIEKKLALLTKSPSAPENPNAWISEIHGTFKNDAAYRKAARLGREYRKAQTVPTPRRSKKK